jgi:hypothetical protein
MYPQLRLVFLLPFLKFPPIVAAEDEHPDGNYGKEDEDIGSFLICFPKISDLVN